MGRNPYIFVRDEGRDDTRGTARCSKSSSREPSFLTYLLYAMHKVIR